MLELLYYSNLGSTFIVFGIAWLLSLLYRGIWRIHFSPVAEFPGPKLAALTYWYEFYYDVVLSGQYVFKIKALHEEYGPIIRINPHELHVIDPDFYHTLYAGAGQKRDRDVWHTTGMGIDDSVITTVSHDLHRKRRAALNPFFSMQSTRKLLPLVQERYDRLVQKLMELKDTGTVINLSHALSAVSNDVINEFCFGGSSNRVEAPDFDPSYYNNSHEAASIIKLMCQIPFILKLLSLPDSIIERLGPGLKDIVAQKHLFNAKINEVRNSTSKNDLERKTIFHSLFEDGHLPQSELSTPRLINEAMTLISAGSHTVSWTLSVACYHILANPSILHHLTAELQQVKPTETAVQRLAELEKLPYLTAVLKESLRLSYGVSMRLPRISPDAPMTYGTWTIPAGTSVSMSTVLMHHHETIFPSPETFNPERCLADTEGRLDKYMVAFSGGSRKCLGINLGWAELYLGLAAVFDAFGNGDEEKGRGEGGGQRLELWETGLGDVEIKSDRFFPTQEEGSVGVRVLIKS